MELPNGTVLEVLQRRDGGWWYVRVVSGGAIGWVLSRPADRVRIACCIARANAAVGDQTTNKLKVVTMTLDELRNFGIAIVSVGSADSLPNKCPVRTYNKSKSGFIDSPKLLSMSDAMVANFKARGFTLDALCLAMNSPLMYDLETGKQLPLATVKGQTGIVQLNVPDCFKNGTPFLDCKFAYSWWTGWKGNTNPRADQYGEEVYANIRAQLMPLKPGNWYYSADFIARDNLSWWSFARFQRSLSLPRGFGYALYGPEGDDPDSDGVDLQTMRTEVGISAPWNQ